MHFKHRQAYSLILALIFCLLTSMIMSALFTQALMQRRIVQNFQEIAGIRTKDYH